MLEPIKKLIPQKLINYKHYLISKYYNLKYHRPSEKLFIIGVTGTDGKTTTCTLLYQMLREAGLPTGMITTINARIGDKEYDTGFHVTTPDPRSLQKFLKDMVDDGLKYVILETTSHGLDQYRIGGIQYGAATFTNVTHEHLDYHKTYDDYLKTKAKLIELVAPGGFVVINKDDRSFDYLESKAKKHQIKAYTYGFSKESDIYATDYNDTTATTQFTLHHAGQSDQIEMHLPGEYNVYNALGAIQVALNLDIDIETIKEALSKVKTLEGRWEIIQKKPFKVVVDFAHTPNALDKVLTFAREDNPKGKIIVVFGSAGKRDIEKRPLMGEAAAKHTDIIILTAEDPRGENIENINRQIAIGIKSSGKQENKDYFSIPDRAAAIRKAVQLASEGDTIVITGKGHEKSLNLDGVKEVAWSDQKAVREILSEKLS